MLESAVVGTLMLLLIVTVLQMALAMLMYNSLSSAARAAARMAIVRGDEAEPEQNAWGPVKLELDGESQHEIMATIMKHLRGIDPEDLSVVLEWPSGMNEAGEDVVVELTVTNDQLPRLTRLFFPEEIRARSIMQIVN